MMARRMGDVLDEIAEYLQNRADADLVGEDYKPNEEMRLLTDLQAARESLLQTLRT